MAKLWRNGLNRVKTRQITGQKDCTLDFECVCRQWLDLTARVLMGSCVQSVAGTTQYIPVYSILYTQVQARRCFTHQPDERLLALVNQRAAARHFLYPQRFYWGTQVLVEAVNI